MKPAIFDDPLYVPKNGAEWDAWIWHLLQETPNLNRKKILAKHDSLTMERVSSSLNRLLEQKQIASLKFLDVTTGRDVLHYSITRPEYIMRTRVMRKLKCGPTPAPVQTQLFKTQWVTSPVQVPKEDAAPDNPVCTTLDGDYSMFSAEEFTKSWTLQQSRKVYDYLHGIFGPRP